jgi:hypothetical protein
LTDLEAASTDRQLCRRCPVRTGAQRAPAVLRPGLFATHRGDGGNAVDGDGEGGTIDVHFLVVVLGVTCS